jgi:uncharacterized NAD(P)/FAD-binding protein YdhS
MTDLPVRTIAIVGCGFSGTATAVHVLRQLRERPLRIVLIERAAEFGRGLAYARTEYPFLLNVPASRMSATTADPEEFLRYAQRREPRTGGEDFVARSLYGEYLQDLLELAIARAPSSAEIERLHGEVVDLADADDEAARLTLANGRSLRAHRVVLALGMPLPRLPAEIRCSTQWPDLRQNPWTSGKRLEGRQRLLVIGTGLTMIDVVTSALDANPETEIHAISRHGLVPPSQTAFRPDALEGDRGLLASSAGSVSRLLKAVRHLADEAERCGGDWREVVTLLRRQVPSLWSSLPLAERSRFLRHVRAYWDIHRHRVPAEILSRVDEARARGQLRVHAGRLTALEPITGGVRATWTVRGSNARQLLDVAEVVDCTGPDYNVARSCDPLWQSLLAQGLAMPDELMLGIRTGSHGELVRRDGSNSARLFYVGPMLRADYWEATAIGELRLHAERLAMHLLHDLPRA